MSIDSQFFIQQFYQYAGWPKYNKYNNTYNACCPLCREGKSWGKKKRLYFIVDDDVVCCHNCGWYGNIMKWIMQVSNKTYNEVIEEIGEIDITEIVNRAQHQPNVDRITDVLPLDSIDLFDKTQIKYHVGKQRSSIVVAAVKYVVERMLHVAINRPRNLHLSLDDPVHKNRICIPFYYRRKIIHYQTRGFTPEDLKTRPKYLSKMNSEKTLFNIDNIKSSIDCMFITEGPIDAFFITNGVAVAGIQENSKMLFTRKQSDQIKSYPLHDQVWCLDSQYLDETSRQKTNTLIDQGCKVFIWPRVEGTQYKDFNDMCVAEQKNSIDIDWVLSNTYTGTAAKVKLKCTGGL